MVLADDTGSNLDDTDLQRVLGTLESPVLEFKREIRDRDAIRKAICALANDLIGTGGGDLIVGVATDGSPYPIDTSDEVLLNIAQLRDEGRLLERPSVIVSRALFRGSPVIRIKVHASATPPVRLDGVAWVRPGPLTKRASAEDERILSERRLASALPFDARALIGTSLIDMDLELLRSTYIAAAVDPEVLAENGRPLEQQLRSLRLIDLREVPTGLGILLGGYDPGNTIPGAYIQFVRYDGLNSNAAIRDDEEIRENLILAARELTPLLQANITRRIEEVDGLVEKSTSDYPIAALREAVMNAVAHRTYDGSNAPVRITWFDDRIEILNPGGPYGVVNEENFDHINDYRNPSLAAAMKSLGLVNRFGRGIERMRRQMIDNGNPPPEFDVGRSWWRVTLRRAVTVSS